MRIANEEGETPMFIACCHGHLEMCRWLHANGRDAAALARLRAVAAAHLAGRARPAPSEFGRRTISTALHRNDLRVQ